MTSSGLPRLLRPGPGAAPCAFHDICQILSLWPALLLTEHEEGYQEPPKLGRDSMGSDCGAGGDEAEAPVAQQNDAGQ